MEIVKKIALALCLALFPLQAAWGGVAGKKAPEFTLQELDGGEVNLAGLKGKVVFLDFWASWCPPCKKEMPELAALSGSFKAEDLAVVAISVDRKRAHAEGFMGSLADKGRLVVLHDPAGSVISAYRAQAMPTSFILDRSGVIRYVHFGYQEDDPGKWRKEIEGLIKE